MHRCPRASTQVWPTRRNQRLVAYGTNQWAKQKVNRSIKSGKHKNQGQFRTTKRNSLSTKRNKQKLKECNINLVNQKHQIAETLKITESNFNITKQDLEYFKKNFQQSETLNEHNYSQEIRILPTKQNISANENNFNEEDTTSQHFIVEKETNTRPENQSP